MKFNEKYDDLIMNPMMKKFINLKDLKTSENIIFESFI